MTLRLVVFALSLLIAWIAYCADMRAFDAAFACCARERDVHLKRVHVYAITIAVFQLVWASILLIAIEGGFPT